MRGESKWHNERFGEMANLGIQNIKEEEQTLDSNRKNKEQELWSYAFKMTQLKSQTVKDGAAMAR